MKKIISILLTILIAFSFASCAKKENAIAYSEEFFDLFDTASKITAYDDSQSSFDNHFQQVFEKLEYYSKLFDIYNVYDNINNLKTINDTGCEKRVCVDSEIIELLDYGIKIYTLTNSQVNIAMGNVLSVWHNYREKGIDNSKTAKLPTKNELKIASKHTDINSIIVDYDNNTVFLNDDISIDVGALAKGFVCEKIAEFIEKNNIWESAVISLGGNVKVVGTKNGSDFNVGVENPFGDDYAAVLKVSNGESVVTSGSYQRYYTVDGKDYCHIINPETLMPADYFKSVTVVCKNSALADAVSTALFTLNIDDGKRFVEQINENENYDNVYVMWLTDSGNKLYSDDFEKEYL